MADRTSPQSIIARLRAIVGRRHVLTGRTARPYAQGYRFGGGEVAAVIRPGSLVEMWRVACLCVADGLIVIVQAANTGLTGGSTPDGDYDRGVVILSTTRIRGVHPILEGTQVVCTAGATLNALERRLAPFGREPYSVIGSSCIGASVIGGVCNNSGGALVDRGPAYTEYALFAQLEEDGHLHLHNHLGIDLGSAPEEILAALDRGLSAECAVSDECRRASAASDYATAVRDISAPSPARYNADASRLFEASGCAGRMIVFAVRLDTFARPEGSAVLYVGTNDRNALARLRRELLRRSPVLPVSGEYIHRDAFDLADSYGKDTVITIRALGTQRLPALFRAKDVIDRVLGRIGIARASDRLLQAMASLLPDHLPARIRHYRDLYEHHLIIKVSGEGVAVTRAMLDADLSGDNGAYFQCTNGEAEAAMLHRFAVAGAAVSYRAIHPREVEEIVALDIALPRNTTDWVERLPPELARDCIAVLYYGHFFCHVFHQDYIVRKGADPVELEHRLLEIAAARGAQYPAEHNVGHLYAAAPALEAHYRRLDPLNGLNPGIGRTSRRSRWQ
jgi:D-lactate dehydrogenase